MDWDTNNQQRKTAPEEVAESISQLMKRGQDAQKALTVLNNIETKEIPKAGEAFGILILLRRHGRDFSAAADFLQTPRRLSMR